jgi:hypothetical protein
MSIILAALMGLTPLEMFPPMNTNLSVIRHIVCDNSSGTGFVTEQGIIATAAHVADDTGCMDADTRMTYKRYYVDAEHDLALMEGKTPVMPLMTLNCDGYKKGKTYFAYGYSNYKTMNTLLRKSRLKGRRDEAVTVKNIATLSETFRLDGYIVFGQSGGPILDENDAITGIVNVASFDRSGNPTGEVYSTELKDTVLCKD